MNKEIKENNPSVENFLKLQFSFPIHCYLTSPTFSTKAISVKVGLWFDTTSLQLLEAGLDTIKSCMEKYAETYEIWESF